MYEHLILKFDQLVFWDTRKIPKCLPEKDCNRYHKKSFLQSEKNQEGM